MLQCHVLSGSATRAFSVTLHVILRTIIRYALLPRAVVRHRPVCIEVT
jgi:hypothetical protein